MIDKNIKTIGIIGGMGPEATHSLFGLIIKATPAKKDQEHIPVIISNNPQIPDRTRHIVYKEESPLPYLVEEALFLERSGAGLILIACNTAHYYVPSIKERVKIPILHMPQLTSKWIFNNTKERGLPNSTKVGVLATTGTITTGLYQDSLESNSLKAIIPTPLEQESIVMEAIYGSEGVKAGFHQKPALLLKEAASLLIERGAEYIIAGCTEIPLVLTPQMITVPLVNSMEVLAQQAVAFAMGGPSLQNL